MWTWGATECRPHMGWAGALRTKTDSRPALAARSTVLNHATPQKRRTDPCYPGLTAHFTPPSTVSVVITAAVFHVGKSPCGGRRKRKTLCCGGCATNAANSSQPRALCLDFSKRFSARTEFSVKCPLVTCTTFVAGPRSQSSRCAGTGPRKRLAPDEADSPILIPSAPLPSRGGGPAETRLRAPPRGRISLFSCAHGPTHVHACPMVPRGGTGSFCGTASHA
jgi:hypothetical protein